MRTPQTFLLPNLPTSIGEMESWASSLMRALDEHLGSIYQDIRYGSSTHRILEAAPGVDDLEEGEIVFVDDGIGGLAIYTKLNGVIRSGVLA